MYQSLHALIEPLKVLLAGRRQMWKPQLTRA
jgi:hypothetical protein